MNEDPIEGSEDLPEPQVKAKRRISTVWLVPLVATLIGAWMAIRSYSDKGPTITITFETAEGLVPGQTRIRYKDVDIGKVAAVTFSPDYSRVRVKAELARNAAGLISSNSRFWVVRARISSSGVSGPYIGMDPGKPGQDVSEFKGLETPPIVTTTQEGRMFTLRAEKLGSINIDSPVMFRHLRVGEVVGYELEKGGEAVAIKIFIRAPYLSLVHRDSRFWNAGSADVSIGANGVTMGADSLMDMLLGGVAFESPTSLDSGEPAAENQVFALYPSHSQINEKVFLHRRYYVVDFNESVRGLTRGAPVEFRGIQVGEVEDIRLEFDTKRLEGHVPVLIVIEPERLKLLGQTPASMDNVLAQLVAKGLRAQLRMGSLISGSLFVDLDFYPRTSPRSMGHYGTYRTIPATPSSMGAMISNLTQFLEHLQSLPLEEISTELRTNLPLIRETLKETQQLLKRLNSETAPQVQATLEQAQRTLTSLEKALGSDAPVQQDLHRTLDELSKAARSIKDLADTLERRPESLIFGKGKSK
jgi:paraquat-inducible protein B